jgi:glycosyltransferase 2 family protein
VARWRRLIMAVVDILVGVMTLYLATRDIGLVDIAAVLGRMELGWVAFSILMYAFSFPIRGLRWWVLLRQISAQRWPIVLEATIAGFAANYVLPARIGELFRADSKIFFSVAIFLFSRSESLAFVAAST